MVLKMRKSDFDMDTVTNIILNNEYDLHEKEEKIESPKEENYKKINKYENNKKKSKHAKNIENTKKDSCR